MNSRLAEVAAYAVRVRGRLDESWFDWLDRVTMTFEPEPDDIGVTVLTGHFDQAALRGLLSYVWDMNLTVLSVDRELSNEVSFSSDDCNISNPSRFEWRTAQLGS